MGINTRNNRNCRGSLTVECALVFPLFLYAMLAIMYFQQIYHLHDVLQQAITKEGLNLARYGYVYQYIKDYEGKGDLGEKCERKALSHSIIYGSTADLSAVCNGSKGENKQEPGSIDTHEESKDGGKSDTLKDLLLTKSINAAFFHLKLQDYVDEDYINKSIIAGGMDGISAYLSDFMGEDDRIDIILTYFIKPPVALPGEGDFFILQRVSVRGWNGYRPDTGEEEGEGEEDNVYVYITENGSVYHLWEDCSYLKLSIRDVPFSNIKNLRNIYGGKYYPCELCSDEGKSTGTVYITDTGDRYHSDINCSGLKRTVLKIPLSEVGNRSLCKRCQKRQGLKQ